jgi:hypothetical protein
LTELAKAQKLAQQQGLLSPSLANKMLPNALVEGHELFGVVDGVYGYPATPRRDAAVEAMGLRMANSDDPRILKQWSDVTRDTKAGYSAVRGDTGTAAKLAALILAEKARLYGEDKAIERWNGKGRAMEDVYGDLIPANAKNHAAKVAEMERMLMNPKNAQIRNTYRGLLGE